MPFSTSGFAPLLPIRERAELMPLFVRRRLTRSLGGEEMRGGPRKNAGRKPVEIDLEDWERLHAMQCTLEEIAGFFSVSTRTIETRRMQPKYAEAAMRARAKGRISVRRQQMH